MQSLFFLSPKSEASSHPLRLYSLVCVWPGPKPGWHWFSWDEASCLTKWHPPSKIYRKVPKFSDTRKLCCNLPKLQTTRPNLRVFHQQDAKVIANSEDPDQTAPRGAVWSGLHCLHWPFCLKTLDCYGRSIWAESSHCAHWVTNWYTWGLRTKLTLISVRADAQVYLSFSWHTGCFVLFVSGKPKGLKTVTTLFDQV